MWSEWPTRREASREADTPGMVRLLSNEPTETERYGHAFALLALIARAEARERERQEALVGCDAGAEGLEPPTYGFGDRRSTN